MAAGDVISNIVNVNNSEYLDIRPAVDVEWIIHNIGYAGAAELYFYDGTNLVKVDVDTTAGSRLGVNLHCTNTKYYRLKNISGMAALMSYDGVQTSGLSFIGDCAYVYVAYASDNLGTNFSTIPDAALNYIAIKTTDTQIDTPAASDFEGLWKKYANTDSPTLLGTYTHSGNKEIHMTALNVDTDTFTSIGHGLVGGERLNAIPNRDIGRAYLMNVIAGGVIPNPGNNAGNYYALVVDADHFQISTDGVNPVDIAANTNLDLTKWHFEIRGTISTIIFDNFPVGKRRIRCTVNGQALYNDSFLYFKPNGINSCGFCYSWNNPMFNSYPFSNQTAVVHMTSTTIIDSNNLLSFNVNTFRIIQNNATSNSTTTYGTGLHVDPRYTGFDIANVKFDGVLDLANGCVIQILDDAGGAAINGIPSGGEVGQQLVKKSAVDYDIEWKDTSVIIADDLVTDLSTSVLSAKQGVVLKGLVDSSLIADDEVGTDPLPREADLLGGHSIVDFGVEPVAVYEHNSNLEVIIQSVDITTSTYTSIGHGLVNGDTVFATLNKDTPIIGDYGTLYYAPNGMKTIRLYVIEATLDTFKLSTTVDVADALVFTDNATMDLSKWHLEKILLEGLVINNLPNLESMRVTFDMRVSSASWLNMYTNLNNAAQGISLIHKSQVVYIAYTGGVNNLVVGECEYSASGNKLIIATKGAKFIDGKNDAKTWDIGTGNVAGTSIYDYGVIINPSYPNVLITQLNFATMFLFNGSMIKVYGGR